MNDIMPAIRVRHLTVSYGLRPALLDVNLDIPQGALVGILGPNGAGKSTLIKALMGFVQKDVGRVEIMGEPAEKAKGRMAYVPQRSSVDWDFPITVEEVTLMGRYGRIPWYRNPGKKDREAVRRALCTVRMEDFSQRQIGALSGGQQQRVFMARALCQGAGILLLDEPFAGVDAVTEKAILGVLKESQEQGLTLVVVHHDLATAASYFDRIALIKQRLVAFGKPEDVLRKELLTEVYEGQMQSFTGL
ncbi:metal ABC transporter ATP-binding protein [Desulfobotulus sp. H1]|uniref:Metal ABC transporter ATP-binding protein n=1 Tax=Desulfobotulus pelophilus TaxID=2823377 RepID=A0ABT3NBX2_9BACT|nr:metal ABC transporter ATP-binding protein [Desulfobotulus pelophilus]MCW7754920.1 metal ABC transporter ATP-binding protein [Desulfobotulus pelophilus]